MANLERLFVFLMVFGIISAQFQNPFSAMMNTGTGNKNNGTGCASRTPSCAPWCSRSLDISGCVVCHCNTGGMRPMGGMNPMSGGMNPMGMNPMSQIAQMFPGMTGGISPMTGSVQTQGQTACPPAPTTCPVPQPWCERISDNNGCIKCLCGNKLVAYVQTLNGQTVQTTQKPIVTNDPTTFSPITTPDKTTHASTTSNGIQSCLDTFYCTKICDFGYKTDSISCPLCECLGGTLIDTPVNATDPPGKLAPTTAINGPITSTTDHLTSCPGIFDCTVICNNGYKTDTQGCPICSCEI